MADYTSSNTGAVIDAAVDYVEILDNYLTISSNELIITGQTGVGSDTVLLNLKANNSAGLAGNVLRFTDTDPTAVQNGSMGKIQWFSTGTGAVVAEINGKNDDATPDGQLIISTAAGASLAQRIDINADGDIQFFNAAGNSRDLHWDATDSRLGINVTTPTEALDVLGNANFTGTVTADGLTVAGNVSVDGGTIKLDGNYPTGTDNVALGNTALDSNSTGNYNTAIGANALTAMTGSSNTAVGFSALEDATTGTQNTGIGMQALANTTTANNNTAVGHKALLTNTTGAGNTAVGVEALDASTTASNNTAVGYQSLYANTTGSDNAAFGRSALGANTTGGDNNAFGRGALEANTTGTANTAMGHGAIDANTTGNYNVGLGANVLTNNTTGSHNVAVGYQALRFNTTSADNVAVGNYALYSQTGGSSNKNVAIGYTALYDLTSGQQNVAVGFAAGANIIAASDNTTLGYQALTTETGGQNNVAVGTRALQSQVNSSGNIFNTAIGSNAGLAISTGVENTLVGGNAGDLITTGSYNTLIGKDTGTTDDALTTGSANTLVGAFCDTTTVGAQYAFCLGYGLDAAAGYTTLGQGANDIRAQHGVATWSTVSDERYKKDILDSEVGLSFISALRPRTFNYKNKGELPESFRAYEEGSTEVFKSSQTQHGFIAQEVKAAIDAQTNIKDGFKLWDVRDDGSQEVAEAALIPVLVKAIQEQQDLIESLTARIAALESN